LLQIVAEVANKLQSKRYVEQHFGKEIPIIIHGLEYAWYDIEATKKVMIQVIASPFLILLSRIIAIGLFTYYSVGV